MSYIQSFRDKVLYNTSQAKQLMTSFVRRYRAGRPVIYHDNQAPEPPSEFGSVEPDFYEGQLPEQPEYQQIEYDFLPKFDTPDFRLEQAQPLHPEPSELEEQVLDAHQEIQEAIDEAGEPENLEDLLRPELFPRNLF